MRSKVVHHGQILSAPLVGGGVSDTQRGIRFGIVRVTVRPNQDRVAVPAVLEVFRTIDIETLLFVSVDRIRSVACQGADLLLGEDFERSRGGGIGGGPFLSRGF